MIKFPLGNVGNWINVIELSFITTKMYILHTISFYKFVMTGSILVSLDTSYERMMCESFFYLYHMSS